jgi:transposase
MLMRAYSIDLRKKIVNAIPRGRANAELPSIFGMRISSVKRYMKIAQEEGSLGPKKAPGKRRKLDESGMKLLQEDVHAWPAAPPMSKEGRVPYTPGCKVSKSTICQTIKRLGSTPEKGSMGAGERDEWMRAACGGR